MIRNYLKMIGRDLWKHRAYTGINIAGLVLGMVCSLMIGLWVHDEWQIDRFHEHSNQLYRVLLNQYVDNQPTTTEELPGPLAPFLKATYPAITHTTRITLRDEHFLLSYGEKNLKVKARYVGGDFFTMLNFPLLQGDPKTALSTPDGLVISASLARALFGTEHAIGRLLRVNKREGYQVKAVMADMDSRSSYQFDVALPFELFEKRLAWAKTWDNNYFGTFIRLAPGTDPTNLEKGIKDVVDQHLDQRQPGVHSDLRLQPYADMYLYNRFENGHLEGGRIQYFRVLLIIGWLILFIACINYANLSTARSMQRTKEVGVRKVIGATRKVLVGHFMTEAFLLVTLSLLIALPIVHSFLPAFNTWTGKQLILPYQSYLFWICAVGIITLTALLSGSYPALFLSGLPVVKLLKGNLQMGGKALFARRSLIVFQFAITTTLIIGTLVMTQQMLFIKSKNLGYNRHHLLLIPTEGGLDQQYSSVRESMLKLPGIQSVTLLGQNPISLDFSTTEVNWAGKPKGVDVPFTGTWVDYDFIKTMQISMKAGRFFTPQFANEISYVINETAAQAMGMNNPIGQELEFWRGRGRIIGVINDYHTQSMHEPIIPMILTYNDRWGSDIMVRISGTSIQPTLQRLEQLVKRFNPEYPFEYHFLDETFEQQYRSETLVSQLMRIFTGFAIFISCLGLFGLVTFITLQRTKEIGLRKVLGASVSSIITLLSQDFLKLVLIALLLASPVAWYVMNRWLQDFAYSIDLEWWVFALAGLLAVGIALLTVSYQSIKAALMNPVKSLRSE